MALIGSSFAETPTIKSGKTRRIPTTAIKIPTVKNILRQAWLIRSKIRALTMALSMESEISNTARIAVIIKPSHPA